ncbi:Xylosylprotein 4-beta-galactosyltransferase [Acanthocheilonema viteae]|uniref:Galactosyltransferase C-terminal domain-containing protein n=1 Tax=Acanthocheilonema viteae TaxID=6277 RepID=A0A498S4P5_ACAVI|nr:unnamed protein product [Acanthocheilonema viteae]
MVLLLNADSIFEEKNIQRWIYIIGVVLFIAFIIGSWKNYVDSDYQLFHWHVPLATIIPTHVLCVLVPYRDRETELQIFVPHIDDFLNEQNVLHKIIVLNQTDALRFNRASLINVGWYEADRVGCDYLVMHDVDLLPLNPQLDYSYPGKGIIRHISSPEYHPKYNYTKFIGGILLLTMSDYKIVNGMSNKYWGWGLEDDEFYLRLRDANLLSSLQRPVNLTTNRSNTFRHIHDSKLRKRDVKKYGNQKQMTRKRDRISGLHSVKYRIVGRNLLNFRKRPVVSVLNIELECDLKWTDYCKA